MQKDGEGKTVYCAMSGGVDSSTSAVLLLERGFSVVGVFIRVWQPPFLDCPWQEDRADAMRVCAHLGIPFREVDFGAEYKREVVEYMIESYKNGFTPNPDVVCNAKIKFGAFFDWAMSEGAEFIATGHYARIEKSKNDHGTDLGNSEHKDFEYKLFTAEDTNKDQTYFLWNLSQKHLRKTFFPIGEYAKSEVRELAKKYNLPTANRKESQGLCFLGKLDMKEFLGHYLPKKEGEVRDESGNVVGSHRGAWFYTLGERHGFATEKISPLEKPWYVIQKNIESNILIVSHNPDRSLQGSTDWSHIAECNWIGGLPSEHVEYGARFRYRQPLEKCTVATCSISEADIQWRESQTAVSIGQSFVLYAGKKVLGGGVLN